MCLNSWWKEVYHQLCPQHSVHTHTHTRTQSHTLCPPSTGINNGAIFLSSVLPRQVTSSSTGALLPRVCRVTSAELILSRVTAGSSCCFFQLYTDPCCSKHLHSDERFSQDYSRKGESVWLHTHTHLHRHAHPHTHTHTHAHTHSLSLSLSYTHHIINTVFYFKEMPWLPF